MLDRPRHPFSRDIRPRSGAFAGTPNLPQVYAKKGSGSLTRIYLYETGRRRIISRLKWIISTCIVGVAGLAVIGVVIYASMDIKSGDGMMASIRREGLKAMAPKRANVVIDEDAATLGKKEDKIIITSKGLTTRHTIHDSVVQRRGNREFIQIKPYVRLVASLATAKPQNFEAIPALNPLELYSSETKTKPASRDDANAGPTVDGRVETRLIDLAGGFLPQEDGQVLSAADIERLVAEADAAYAESEANLRPSILPEGDAAEAATPAGEDGGKQAKPAQTIRHGKGYTIAAKTVEEEADIEDETVTRTLMVKPNDTLAGIIKTMGVEAWQTGPITNAITAKLPDGKLRAGQEFRYTVLKGAGEGETAQEPLRISLFTGVDHIITLERNAAGEYNIGDKPVELQVVGEDVPSPTSQRSTVYLSTFQAAMAEDLPRDFIMRFLRIHSYDVDFKLRVKAGDGFELFYEQIKDENGIERPGELLYAAFTIGGQTQGYYRFRTPDGDTDYYDERGSNSKKFLMRTPIKSGRLTSGFGYRRHPLLGYRKLHTGVDWGAPVGTPILAAGNGVIEVAGREGGYGNYIRIRHGNGYKTAYAHMSGFAPGMVKGAKVRQGMVIGYVGSTGLSSGPHLHYEVLVNNRHVNPLSIQVPRSRQLQGRLLADFKKEKNRIDELMRRAPVKTRIATIEK